MFFCISGPVCGKSTAHWRIPLLAINSVELSCLIHAFRVAGGTLMLDQRFPNCWPSVWCLHLLPVDPPHERSEALMSSFMFVQTSCWTNSGCASESKTHETQIMLLLCNLSFRNWLHCCPFVRWNHWSPVDSRCKGSLEWSFGGPVCCDGVDSPHKLTNGRLDFFSLCLSSRAV